MSEWISVFDVLPEQEKVVLVAYYDKDYLEDGWFRGLGMLRNGKWRYSGMLDNKLSETNCFEDECGGGDWHKTTEPVYWMELPELPEDELL